MKSQLRLMAALSCGMVAWAVIGHAAPPQRVIDDSDRVVLPGNVHPLARPEFDAGRTDGSVPEERIILALAMRPEKKAALERLLAEQQDPGSPNFHHWLTPEEFGTRFGAAPDEIAIVASWLRSHGFALDEVGKGRTWINFTGTVADVEAAFRTEIHDYVVAGNLHHANSASPSIPRALADLVVGVVSLHDFRAKPASHPVRPDNTRPSGAHWLSPGDFATIYNVNPLYSAGIDGTGQSVAVVGRSNIKLQDVQNFRSYSGLPANDPQFIINGTDPGIVSDDDEQEADLDVEWAGAVAKGATIKFVISKSTNAADGVELSAQYVVNHNLAPITTMSFSGCESALGSSGNAFASSLAAQAASQGITSFVCSGDSGAAGCDKDTANTAAGGQAVNGLCSMPYGVCVGGTEFMDTSNPSQYWSTANAPTTWASALSYIPEQAWNESGTAANCPPDDTCEQLWATGGGASAVYTKPTWQVAPGVPNDGARDTPDVSLAAATHNAYIVFTESASASSSFYGSGGTSAATPSLAGLMALIVQKMGQRQGNANPRLYQLANAQYSGTGPAVFHDVTVGNNSVPGQGGFSCGAGYDLATGLGSVDATALANNWSSSACAYSIDPTSQSFTAAGGSGSVNVNAGSSCSWTATSNASNWLHVTSGASGTGNGAVGYSVDANSGSARSGTLTIAGQVFTVAQSAASSGGNTVTIFSDDFEGSFPGVWQLYHSTGTESTTLWGKSSYRAAGGSHSVWCAGGGTSPQPPGSTYVPNMGAWFEYGPFDLSDATAATVDFDLWSNVDAGTGNTYPDRIALYVSTDDFNSNYGGFFYNNTGQIWQHKTFNLKDVTSVASIGANQVYIAFLFTADSSIQYEGSYIDNVVIRKTTAGAACSFSLLSSSQSFQSVGGTGSVGVTVTSGSSCSWTATSNTSSWLHITSGASGTGNGTVGYSVDANSGSARSGALTIAGQSFTANQAAAGTTVVVWVPVASHTSGLNQSQWRSDLGLLNPGTVTANVQIQFYGGSTASTTITVPAGTQSILTDVVGQLGGSGSGPIQIVSDQPLKVTARSYNQVSSSASCYPNGTQGQDYPVLTASGGLSAGQSAYLAGLSENASYHCNIGVVDVGPGAATVLVELFNGAGSKLTSYTVSLTEGQWAQETQPFKNRAGQTAMDRGYAKVTVQSGSGVFGFASVIDNITNDPTTVVMQQ